MNRSTYFLLIFAAVSITELLSMVLDWPLVQWVVKPLIVLSLIAYFVAASPQRNTRFVTALLFCCAGDVLLLFQSEGPIFFMLGLAAFLFGHIGYILSYIQFQGKDRTHELLNTQKIRYSLPFILWGTGLVTILFPHLGDLKVPVMVYAIVLILMVMTAIFRYGRTTVQSFWQISFGAALFMLSDSLLAINKFYSPIPQSGLLVMLTYIPAQYLIVKGVLAHQAEIPKPK